MRLKKDLVLRKVAGEYIVVPIGRLSKFSPMMQITSSTAWLWDVMKEGEFTEDSLVEAVLGIFPVWMKQEREKTYINFWNCWTETICWIMADQSL